MKIFKAFRKNLKKFRYRLKYNYSPWIHPNRPQDITLELSSFCNMKCRYCYHAEPDNLDFRRAFMPYDLAERILYSGSMCRIPSVKFTWKGEQTLNPDFEQIALYAKGQNEVDPSTYLERTINTNFYFQNNIGSIFRGLDCMTKVKISFDSFVKEVFEGQRGGDHDLVLKNIDSYYSRQERNNEIVIQMVRTNLNIYENFEEQVKKRWPLAKVSVRDVASNRNREGYKTLLMKPDDQERIPCRQAFGRIIFNAQGEVYACCNDISEEYKLGDIEKNSVIEIFNNLKARKLRKELKNLSAFYNHQRFPHCFKCRAKETYKGYKPNWEA